MLVAARSNNELMNGIAKESREQATAIEEVTTAVRQMDEMTQHNAGMVEEINAAIEQTERQATDLDRIVDVFTLSDAGQSVSQGKPERAGLRSVPLEARPVAVGAKAGGIRELQAKATLAAKSYLGRSNAAVKEDDRSKF